MPRVRLFVFAALACLVTAGLHSTSARADSRACDRYAAPRGSDKHGRGTARHPFHSVGRLDRALRPGQTGCLLPGTYGGIHTMSRLRSSGTRTRRITITSYPVGAATLVGYVALEGSYTTVSHLRIDGSNTLLKSSYANSSCPARRLAAVDDRRAQRRAPVRRLLPVGAAPAQQRHRDRLLGQRRQHDHPLLEDPRRRPMRGLRPPDLPLARQQRPDLRQLALERPSRPRRAAISGPDERARLQQRDRSRRRGLRDRQRARRHRLGQRRSTTTSSPTPPGCRGNTSAARRSTTSTAAPAARATRSTTTSSTATPVAWDA